MQFINAKNVNVNLVDPYVCSWNSKHFSLNNDKWCVYMLFYILFSPH